MSKKILISRLAVCAMLAMLIAPGTVVFSAAPDTLVQPVTSGSNTYTLRMTKQNFRGPNFEVLVQNSSGGYDDYTPDEVRTYLGTVDEDVSAVVAGYLRTDGVLRAAIFFDRGGTYYTESGSVVKTNGWAVEVFNFPTTPTVAPGHAGSTMYEWGIGYDVDYNNFIKELQSSVADAVECVEVTNVFMALNFMQCGLVKPMVERVIIRTSQQHCPYYGTSGTALLPLLRDEWNNNQSDAMAYCYKAALGTSEIGGGVAYGNGKFTVNDTWGDLEIFYSVGRHELGHNWGVGDYDGGSPEGVTINCGNQYARWCGTGVQDILNHRDNYLLGSGYELNIGTYTAVDIAPYASLDAAAIGQGSVTTFDTVANDHDTNGDALILTGVFDVVSQNGGLVTLSSGTGPGGRDELQYTPPGVLGFDTFSYQIVDSTGMTQTGRVHIMVEEFASFIYEAEDAVIVGAQIDQFWVDYINASGDYVEWTVDVATTADYDLAWRYSLASGDRPLEIKVNGQVVEPSMSFPATGSFGTWDFTAPLRVSLNAGTNTVRATAIGYSGANIDYLKVTETIDTSGPQAPYFYYDPTDKPFALVGQSYDDTLADTANDPDLNETLTFSKVAGPDWLNVASDGTLSGTPIPADLGTNVFTVRVTDSTALTADTTLIIDVYQKTGEATYEAEDAVYVGPIFGNYYGGYTGTGYVDYQNSSGDYVLWTINASEAGLASLEFRYALGSGDRPLEIMVNDQVIEPSLSFPSTGSFGTWDYTSILMVMLNAGDNTVQATAIGSSGPNMDHLKVGFYSTSGGDDTTPPTPDPMTWATLPYSTGTTSIAMVANNASDPSGVEYYFTCTAGGGNDSGWQSSPTYEDTSLTPDTSYTYTVKARDKSSNQNETAPSTAESATTEPFTGADDAANADIPVQGNIGGSYADTQTSDNIYESITEVRQGNPVKGFSSLEHKWTINVTGGTTVTFYLEAYKTASPDGDDFVFAYSTDDVSYTNLVTVTKTSDDDTYQSYALPASTSGTVYIRVTDTDSTQGSQDMDTVYVDDMYIHSGAGAPDSTPPTPDPMDWATVPYATSDTSIAMQAVTASDPSGVEYYFTCTAGGGNDSGWQDSTLYEDTGLQPATTYTYTVTARDKSSNQNTTAPSTAESATTDAGCTPIDCHVESIVCGTVSCAPPNVNGLVAVTIYDNCGNPVVNALVDGTFTGDFSETFYDVATDANGQAVFTTAGCIKKPGYTFCIDDVTHGTLPYDSGDNVETCDSY